MADHSKILIIEDDPHTVGFLQLGLRQASFDVYVAADGRAGIELFCGHQPDLVLLDLMLPGLDGWEVCRRLRAHSDVPILVLTARDDVRDKVNLFALGADDYIVKPFSFDELLARIRVALRKRGRTNEIEEMTFSDIVLRVDTREVLRSGVTVQLTAKEFDLLRYFMSNPRRVLTKETILNQIWGYEYTGDSNIVEVYVGRLRRALGEPPVIHTVRGVGYSLRAYP